MQNFPGILVKLDVKVYFYELSPGVVMSDWWREYFNFKKVKKVRKNLESVYPFTFWSYKWLQVLLIVIKLIKLNSWFLKMDLKSTMFGNHWDNPYTSLSKLWILDKIGINIDKPIQIIERSYNGKYLIFCLRQDINKSLVRIPGADIYWYSDNIKLTSW